MQRNVTARAFKATLPVLAGYIVLGMGFGAILQSKGYGVGWAALMSVTMYSGSMQYVAVDLIASGASIVTAALTTLLVNARHLFYGISLADKYKGAGAKKAYMMFALTDETYSLACMDVLFDNDKEKHKYYFLISLFDHMYWIAGGILGSLLGMILPFSTEGMDFVLTALFVTIFVDQWKSTKEHIPAIFGVFISIVCLVIFGSESFLIPAMVIIAVVLAVLRGKVEVDGE